MENNKTSEWTKLNIFYWAVIVFCISVCGLILISIGLEISQQASRKIKMGAEIQSQKREKSRAFRRILDDLRDDSNGFDSAINSAFSGLKKMNSDEDTRRMIIGLATYKRLKQYVDEDDGTDYSDVRKQISDFTDSIRTTYKITPDTIFFGYLARDIILFIFSKKEIFYIHDEDRSIMGDDRVSLSKFCDDSLAVYDLLRQITVHQLKDEEGFFRDSVNADLFAVAMYCKARLGTIGINKNNIINECIQQLKDNQFKMDGQRGRWFEGLKNDLNKVQSSSFQTSIKKQSPSFITTVWLKG